MVRKYIRKTARRSWTRAQLAAALRDVKHGQSKNSVAVQYNIPMRTLCRYWKRRQQQEDADESDCADSSQEVVLPHLGHFVPVFNQQQEDRIEEIIIRMSDAGYGLTRDEARSLAFKFAESNNITNPFDQGQQRAGPTWLTGFRSRHPKISLRKAEFTSMARSTGFNREAVNVFYDNLQRIYAEHQYPPDRIYNADETGISTVPNKGSKVLAPKGRKQVAAVSSAERGENVTVMMCVSAAGHYIPPMFIFPRKRMKDALKKDAPIGSIFTCTQSGWSNVTTCATWFDHFLAHTRPTAENPVLLILDGHYSHTKNIEMLEKAARNHVRILSIPPHTSHKLQPLDLTLMGPLKTKYGQAVNHFLKEKPGQVVTIANVAKLTNEAYTAAATMESAISGFRSAGIYPFNRELFADADFAIADYLDTTNKTADKGVQTELTECLQLSAVEACSSSGEENSVIFHHTPEDNKPMEISGPALQHAIIPKVESTGGLDVMSTSNANAKFLTDPNVVDQHGVTTIKNADSDMIGLSTLKPSLESRANTSRTVLKAIVKQPNNADGKNEELTIERVRCKAVPRKRQTQKRRREQSEELTSTTYREQLLQSTARKELTAIKKVQRRAKRKKDDCNENLDVLCASCGACFSESTDGKGWMMCIKCRVWYHSVCDTSDQMMCEACF